MSEQREIYVEEIAVLEQERQQLDQAIHAAQAQKKRCGFLQNELQRQHQIKQTIASMESQNRLIADEVPANAQMVSYNSQPFMPAVRQTQGKSAAANADTNLFKGFTNPVNIIIFVLSVVIAGCAMPAWLSIAGHDVDLMALRDGLDKIGSWGFSSYVDKYKALIWLIMIGIWMIAVEYIIVMQRVMRGRDAKKQAISGTSWTIVMIVILLLMSRYISSRTNGWVNIHVNMPAYIAVVLSIVVLVICLGQNQEVGTEAGPVKAAAMPFRTGGADVEYAVANSYPWMDIQLSAGIMNQGNESEFSARYTYQGFPIEEITPVKMGSSIRMITDIVMTTLSGVYVVRNAELVIANLQREGRTEKIYLNANVGQVQLLKVYVKTVVIDEREMIAAAGFHVE